MNNPKKISLFILLTITLNVLLFISFKAYTSNRSSLLLSDEEITNNTSYKYVFTGDSHVVRCVLADSLDNSFNYAYYGENPVLTYYRIKHLINDLKIIPETIVLEVDVTRFCKNYIKHFKNKFYYTTFTDLEELLQEDVFTPEEYLTYTTQKFLPHLEMITVIKRANNLEHDDKKTFKDLSDEDRKQNVKDFITKELMPKGCEDLSSPIGLKYFQKTIEFCQNHNINLVAIKYPVTDYYLKAVQEECTNLDLKHLPQDSILNLYDIPLYDLEEIFEKDYELFSDGHHMNKKGQIQTTQLINKLLY